MYCEEFDHTACVTERIHLITHFMEHSKHHLRFLNYHQISYQLHSPDLELHHLKLPPNLPFF
jgi:hypothetical protein